MQCTNFVAHYVVSKDLDDDAMRSKLQESCGSLDGEPGDHVAPPNIRPVATPARANRDVGPEKGTGKLQQGKYKKPLTRQDNIFCSSRVCPSTVTEGWIPHEGCYIYSCILDIVPTH